MFTIDDYYEACEKAITAQSKGSPLAVHAALQKAVHIRDTLLDRAKVRLEFHAAHDIVVYWDATLSSIAIAAKTKKAAILLEDPPESGGTWEEIVKSV